MARIRTIKPEFPQSEGIGKLSRDARLLYIQLWTIVDDEGRSRAASRMLASLLYPYDDDAKSLIDGWLSELEGAHKIRRYEVDGSQYLEITKWLEHQKIDKPSKSRLPPPSGNSRGFANAREASDTDLVPSTLDLGPSDGACAPKSRDEKNSRKVSKPLSSDYKIPDTVAAYASSLGLSSSEIAREHTKFCNHAKQTDRRCVEWAPAEETWMIGAAERLGKTPSSSSTGPPDWKVVLELYKKTGHWSKWAGPDPESPSCQVPRDLLEQYGIPLPSSGSQEIPAMRTMQ